MSKLTAVLITAFVLFPTAFVNDLPYGPVKLLDGNKYRPTLS